MIKNQAGAGLMVVQQFGGANALSTYASDVFEYAGTKKVILILLQNRK